MRLRLGFVLGLAVLSLTAACGTKPDDCQRFADKAAPSLRKLAQAKGKSLSDADLGGLVTACRAAMAKPDAKRDPAMDCVLAAKDDQGAAACFEAGMKKYATQAKLTEAPLQLNKIGKNAKVRFVELGAFPKGTSATLPPAPCCAAPDHKCPVTDAWAKDPLWQALDFQVDEPSYFQYAYASDGTTGTVTAVGDPMCDGHPRTYRLELAAPGGDPTAKLVEPPADQ